MPTYTFAPLREEHVDLVRRWLKEPHVSVWWHDDPRETDYPEGTIREWLEAIRGTDPTDMFLIEMDGRPIGVIQSYRVQDYPNYVDEFGELDETAFSVDLFIGEPDLVGRGHGTALLREFVRAGFDRYGVDYCVIGPSKRNLPAIRSYEKVGFRYLRDYREDDTSDPEHVLLDMRRGDL